MRRVRYSANDSGYSVDNLGPHAPTPLAGTYTGGTARPEPNPARGATTLRFALPAEAHVRLSIYDASGRRVRLLVDGVNAAGEHGAAWDLRDDGGRAVGAGLYFVRFEAGGRTFTQRVIALQ